MLSALSPLLGENALFKDVGEVFHPIFELFGLILAGIYSVVPSYGVAIIGLTIIIMLALTPITIKSTKSMLAMQRLQPEMKKLQAKYKGPENREQLNAEMMKLYKENGTSPFGACMPMLLQTPFLIVLYSLIRGLSYGVTVKGHFVAMPRYIPKSSKMYHNLVANKGQMHAIFGMDLSSTPFAHHGANQALLTIPYLVLIGMAIFLQYYQMKQMNSRNPQAAQANPQMQQMQKFFPIIFGLIYLRVPAGATIYMVVSSAMRIATQEIMFRTGMVSPVKPAEREIGGSVDKPEATGGSGKSGSGKPAVGSGTGRSGSGTGKPAGKPAVGSGTGKSGSGETKAGPKDPTVTNGSTNGKPPANGAPPTVRKTTAGAKPPANGKANGNKATDAEIEAAAAPKPHPRSRSKRTRKAR
jgi:YidC/Oxa1 family membrane protein insertase